MGSGDERVNLFCIHSFEIFDLFLESERSDVRHRSLEREGTREGWRDGPEIVFLD
jgi:hypothetical protein